MFRRLFLLIFLLPQPAIAQQVVVPTVMTCISKEAFEKRFNASGAIESFKAYNAINKNVIRGIKQKNEWAIVVQYPEGVVCFLAAGKGGWKTNVEGVPL